MKHNFLSAKQFGNSISKAIYLYKNIWKQCTTALIHAPREVNKTDRALDIAIDIAAKGSKVLYVNVDKNLDAYSDIVAECDNIVVFNPQFESSGDRTDYADLVFEAIEQAVTTTSIRVFVIDSVSRMAALSFGRNASAAYIMKRLVALQIKYQISILAVAHDMNRTATRGLVALADIEIDIASANDAAEPVADFTVRKVEIPVSGENAHELQAENLVEPELRVELVDDNQPAPRCHRTLSTRLSIACQRNALKKQKRRKR